MKHFACVVLATLSATACFCGVGRAAAPLPEPSAEWTGLMVPAYFDPGQATAWSRLAAAASHAPVVAIANVFNGPGTRARADYSRVLGKVRESGGRVIGYVSTAYTRRPLADVMQDVDRWAQFYVLDGIFVDEMTNDGKPEGLTYYRELRSEALRRNANWMVVGNPGTGTREAYLTTPTADVLVTFENRTGYPGHVPDGWVRRHPAAAFCHLTYEIPDAGRMAEFVRLSRNRGAGWIYVTDDGGNNPWDRLPSYWEEEVAVVREQNSGHPILLEVTPSGADSVRLRVEGIPGRYTIEASVDLLEWQTLYASGAPTGRVEVVLTTAGVSGRFLRAWR